MSTPIINVLGSGIPTFSSALASFLKSIMLEPNHLPVRSPTVPSALSVSMAAVT